MASFGSSDEVTGCSGILEKIRFRLIERDCKSRIVSLITPFSLAMTVVWVVSVLTEFFRVWFSCVSLTISAWLNSRLSRSDWKSLCSVSMSDILASREESFIFMERRFGEYH